MLGAAPTEAEAAAAAAADLETRECLVCRDDLALYHFPSTPVTQECSHPHDVCLACISQHLEHQLQSAQVTTAVTCPSAGCAKRLRYADVRRLASDDSLERYTDVLVHEAAQYLPNFRWCTNPRCKNGQEYRKGWRKPRVRCNLCSAFSCFHHRVPWHEGLTCAEYDRTQGNTEQASGLWIRKKTKRCPNCDRKIEKDGGCDHMTCQRNAGGCGHEFCWRCGADYDPIRYRGNYRHKVTCKNFRPPMPSRCSIM